MTEDSEEKREQHHDETGNSGKCCRGKHKCRRFGRAIFGVLAIIGIVTLASAAFGPSCGFVGWHHAGHHWGAPDTARNLDWMTDRLIDHANATPAQEQQIKTITSSYLPRIEAMKGEHLNTRNELSRIFTMKNINRAELERVRQDALVTVNKDSEVIVQMLADIADVLTQEQRQKLAAEFAVHHSR
ncbi:Spy/CpxP family protein refolding chaperone [Mariprofundus ferrooxydans]|uniref:Spy/CpxP family protein refolding chaperone n=1 Tax=Mariprofundus ferrooxydans TaxID=314344 RepID=UPI0004757376|nr:Spy/CpxP family protein refolding chaperone [Mariprofundus ferrooxydans]